jgi:hypothetical protein
VGGWIEIGNFRRNFGGQLLAGTKVISLIARSPATIGGQRSRTL